MKCMSLVSLMRKSSSEHLPGFPPSSTGEKDTGPRQGGKYHGYDVSKSPQTETFHISDYCFTYIIPSDKHQGDWCLDSSCRNIPY